MKSRMSTLSSLQQHHRHGMVYLDDSSSGEYGETDNPPPIPARHYEYSPSSSSPPLREPDYTYRELVSPPSSITSDSEDSYYSEGDDIAEYWDPYLYQLQSQAPQPTCIPCQRYVANAPPFYGLEYHGSISRDETTQLLGDVDGNYLVRKGLSHSGTYSLSFVFEKQVRHYKLYHEDGYHYVGEKPFDTIEDLVQDGLITLYMEANNVDDYLRSARDTRITQRLSIHEPSDLVPAPVKDPPPEEESPVFREKELSDEVGDLTVQSQNVQLQRPRKLYQPCTIKQRRDCTLIQSPEREGTSLAGGQEKQADHSLKVEENSTSPIAKGRKTSTIWHYEKAHNFKLHNYVGIKSWCDYCRNFMWGLRNQGFKCKDCGFNAHKQCKDETASDCQPSHQLIKRVFGVELTTFVKMEGTKVPSVIKDCIEEIEKRGMEIEGLYRMSGKKNDILRLKEKFDSEMSADLSKFEDIHALTGAMKLYLRELPIPLVTYEVYDVCLIAVRMGSLQETLDMLKVALQRLAPAHYNTLSHLIQHLHRVQLLKDENRMDSKNLALVFSPSIIRSPHLAAGVMAVQRLPEEKKVIDLLIQHHQSLFLCRSNTGT